MKTKLVFNRLRSTLCVVFALLSFNLMAQNATISGTVSDESGTTLPGVSVFEVGTTNGTITDIDGNYTISVASDATLAFSFVGMTTQEIPAEGKTSINVTLAVDAIGLEEVIAIGYGTQKKADLTGSVSTVKGENLTIAATPSLTHSLAGKISGVTAMSRSGAPGNEDVDFFIRGKSTFKDGNNSPLVLVDGIERSMNRINPSDIESVTILKDAASAAIYGVKGANGVILITTKRAKSGKAEISYSGNFGTQSPLYLPDLMNSAEYAEHLNQANYNIAELDGDVSKYTPVYSDTDIASFKDGTGPNTDWWEQVFNESAPIQTHNLTISNGNDKIRYRTSFEVLDQQGLYEGSDYRRYNLRTNIDGDITKNLSMSLNLAGRIDERNQSAQNSSMFQLTTVSYPTFAPYIEIDGKEELHWNGLNSSPIGYAFNSGYENHRNSVFESSMKLAYNVPFIKGMTATYTYAFDKTFYSRKDFLTAFTFYDGPDAIDNKKSSIPEHELTERITEKTRQTGQATLSYEKQIDKHHISGLFVFEHSDYRNKWIEAYRDGFLSDALDQMFAGSTARIGNNGSESENARIGYALRANYNYDDRYLIQLNSRYDKSFNFPKDHAGGWFPAFSAAWRASNESFMQDIDWISNLKLRVAGGIYGNDRISPYQYMSLYEFSDNRNRPSGTVTTSGYNQAISPDVIPNPNITWEIAKIGNIGLDYALFGGKISGDFEVFKKRTEGLLISREDIPVEIGASIAPYNIGIVENQGFETTLRFKEKAGDFNYNIEGVVTYATSEIIEMSEGANVPDGLKQTGRPFDSRYGFVSDGLFQNEEEITNSADQSYFGKYQVGDIKYVDISGPDGEKDGIIDGNDRTYIGKSGMPELVFGLNTYLEYKGFELTANFQGATGYTHRFKPSPFVNQGNGIQAYTDAWTTENTDGWLPRLYLGNSGNNDANSDYWLTDAWFLKLRSAELAYSFSNVALLDQIGIKALRVSVSGSNLLGFSNVDFWDPEASDVGTHPMYYMQMRTINGGIQVTF